MVHTKNNNYNNNYNNYNNYNVSMYTDKQLCSAASVSSSQENGN